jgi:hypothetical protein
MCFSPRTHRIICVLCIAFSKSFTVYAEQSCFQRIAGFYSIWWARMAMVGKFFSWSPGRFSTENEEQCLRCIKYGSSWSTKCWSSIHSKKFSGRNNINTGTVLILLSDDKTGFVPYRIDNFSMEVNSLYCLALFENWMIYYSNNTLSINSEVANISAEMWIYWNSHLSLHILSVCLGWALLSSSSYCWGTSTFLSVHYILKSYTHDFCPWICTGSWRTKFGYIQSQCSQWRCSFVITIHIRGKSLSC